MYNTDCKGDIGNFERAFKLFDDRLTCISYFEKNGQGIHSSNIITSKNLNKIDSLENNFRAIGSGSIKENPDDVGEMNNEVEMIPIYQASYDDFSKTFCSNYETYLTIIEPEQSKYTQQAFAYFWNLWSIFSNSQTKTFASFKYDIAEYKKLFENLLNSGDLAKHIGAESKTSYMNHIFRESLIKCYIQDANEGGSAMANAGRVKLKTNNPNEFEFEIKKITISSNNDKLNFVRSNIEDQHLKMWNYGEYGIATIDDARKFCAGEKFKSIDVTVVKNMEVFFDGAFSDDTYLPFSNKILTFEEFIEYHN